MDNKKKPSILTLVTGHHEKEFEQSGTLFQPEMLTWKILNPSGNEMLHTMSTIYQNALSGLMNLHPFEVKISMGVNAEEKKLVRTHRTWCKIYLGRESILTFSHDTRVDNRAFYSLIDWPELDSLEENRVEEAEGVIYKLFWWKPEDWSNFFKERIQKKADALQTKADAKRKDADTLEAQAGSLRLNLNPAISWK